MGFRNVIIVGVGLGLGACGASRERTEDAAVMPDADGGTTGTDGGAAGEDFAAAPSDFECITGWTKVRKFRITNKLGHMTEALAVANSPTGGEYPVGTIIQLVPFEAMVKRARGWNAATRDWEFFTFDISSAGTSIFARGTTNVVNRQDGDTCLGCHMLARPEWDMICETDHGCAPLIVKPGRIDALQASDARCHR
jgi:hypothetical protein